MSYGYFYYYNKIRNSNNKRDIQTPLMSNLNYLVSQNKNKGIMNNKKNNNNNISILQKSIIIYINNHIYNKLYNEFGINL